MNDPIGEASEELVERICTRMFFRDFVARSPEFKRAGGEQKEAADVLVYFKRTLLAFQVKARGLAHETDRTSPVVLGRLEERVRRMLKQLKTIRRAAAAGFLTELETARGVTIPVDTEAIDRIVGIAILDVVDEEELPEADRPSIFDGFADRHGVPSHVFLRSTFEILASELDTLPDFLKYLEIRQQLLASGCLGPLTREEDLLALVKTDYPTVKKALDGQLDVLLIEDGIWEQYQRDAADARARRTLRNRPSYAIDEIIEWFHTWIGFSPGGELETLAGEGSVEGYLRAVTELASLNRLERRVLGERLLAKMTKADSAGTSYGLVIDHERTTGHFLLATDQPRPERSRALGWMCHVVAAGYDLSHVVGIGTEPMSEQSRSFDIAVVNDPNYTEEQRLHLRKRARELLGAGRQAPVQEWD